MTGRAGSGEASFLIPTSLLPTVLVLTPGETQGLGGWGCNYYKPGRFTFTAIQLLLHSLQERARSFATPFPPSPRSARSFATPFPPSPRS